MDEILPEDEFPPVSPGAAMSALSESDTGLLLEWINENSPFTEAQLLENWKPSTPQDLPNILQELLSAEWIIKVPSQPVKYYLSSDPYFFALRRRLILCHRSVGNLLQEVVSILSNAKILQFELAESAASQLFSEAKEVSTLISQLETLFLEAQALPPVLRAAGANLADPSQVPRLEKLINEKWEETDQIYKPLLSHLKFYNEFKAEEEARPKREIQVDKAKNEKGGFSKLIAEHSIPPMEPHLPPHPHPHSQSEREALYHALQHKQALEREAFLAQGYSLPPGYYGQKPSSQHPNYSQRYYPASSYPIREPIRAQPPIAAPREWSSRVSSADRAFTGGESLPPLAHYARHPPEQVDYQRGAPWGRAYSGPPPDHPTRASLHPPRARASLDSLDS